MCSRGICRGSAPPTVSYSLQYTANYAFVIIKPTGSSRFIKWTREAKHPFVSKGRATGGVADAKSPRNGSVWVEPQKLNCCTYLTVNAVSNLHIFSKFHAQWLPDSQTKVDGWPHCPTCSNPNISLSPEFFSFFCLEQIHTIICPHLLLFYPILPHDPFSSSTIMSNDMPFNFSKLHIFAKYKRQFSIRSTGLVATATDSL